MIKAIAFRKAGEENKIVFRHRDLLEGNIMHLPGFPVRGPTVAGDHAADGVIALLTDADVSERDMVHLRRVADINRQRADLGRPVCHAAQHIAILKYRIMDAEARFSRHAEGADLVVPDRAAPNKNIVRPGLRRERHTLATDSIVAGTQEAVFHQRVLCVNQIDSIAVLAVGEHPHPVNMNVFAAEKRERPMRGTDKNDVGYGNVFVAGKDHAAPRVPVQRGQIDDACTADADIFLPLCMDKILIIWLSSPIVCFQNRLCLVWLFRNEDCSRRKVQRLPAFELQWAETVTAGLQQQDRLIHGRRGLD